MSGELTSGGEKDAAYRRITRAWAMYDWANSAFATVIVASIYPVYFRSLARSAGLANETATAVWSYSNSAAMLLIAVAGPVLGAIADTTGRKKTLVAGFAAAGMLATASLALLGGDAWIPGALLFMAGMIGFAGSLIFYDALLPHVARQSDIDRVSALGYALGYLGGGVLLVINLLWLNQPSWFFMSDREFALRACFVSVAVWWLVFSVPLFRHVPEPAGRPRLARPVGWLRESFQRLAGTFRQARRYRQLGLFLAAFWIYNDGISTIIKLAVAYGDEIGIAQTDLVLALVVTQFVGVPCAMAFGALGPRLGTKRAILLGLAMYGAVCVCGFFVKTAAHFYMLALAVGLVQGGTQALSRSLFVTMVPKNQAAEFFGFFSTGEKFAGIVGPLLFGLIGQLAGTSRWGIVSVTLLFLVGSVLLLRVDEREGCRVAQAADESNHVHAET